MQEPMEESAAPNSVVGIGRIVFFLRRFWWVPMITLILALGAAGAYVRYWAPPQYVSSASMWETEKLRLPDGAAFSEDLQNYLGNQMELLRSDGMEKRVVARMQTARSNSVPLGKDGLPMKVDITVKQAPKSTIFTIEATTANPAFAQSYLDALLNEYQEYKKNVRKTVSGDTLASISEQVLRLEKELKEEQASLAAFEQTNNMVIMEEEGKTAGSYLIKLQSELSDLELESKLLDATAAQREADASQNTNSPSDSAFDPQESGASFATASSSDHLSPDEEIQLLKSERAKLSENYRPKHPKIVKLDAQIERDEKIIEMSRERSRERSREQLAASRQDVKRKMENIAASIKEWEGKIVEANNRIAEAEHLKVSVNRTQSLFDRLEGLLQNVDISRNIDQETLTVLEQASPATQSHANEIRLLGVSGVGGLCLGLGLIFLIGIRDDRFNSLAEVNAKFGNVIVGQVPEMPLISGKPDMPLLQIKDERDVYAESYRSLRSAIFFMPQEGERPRILLVTSALPNEGKSTIAANLARTLAMGGSRVLLVDADMRRGYLHDLLGMRIEPGLSDLLERPDELETIIQHDSIPNFSFLSRGKSIPNPGDLFLTTKLDQVFARLRKEFDYVLIDSSPIFATDDVASLAPKTDGTLFVVRNRFSSAGAVREALEMLGQRQVRVLGLVFNRADTSARSYRYYKNPEYYRPKKTA
jgi:capsular exopolysaccharide synthesis family protein